MFFVNVTKIRIYWTSIELYFLKEEFNKLVSFHQTLSSCLGNKNEMTLSSKKIVVYNVPSEPPLETPNNQKILFEYHSRKHQHVYKDAFQNHMISKDGHSHSF